MNKFIILAAVATFVAGEAPPGVGFGLTDFSSGGSYDVGGGSSGGDGSGLNEYVNEALLARVGELISRGGDGSGTPQGTEGRIIDADIISRVSGSLADGAAGSGPGGPRPEYGAPTPSKSSGPVELGQPEPAERIAEFDLSAEAGEQQGQGPEQVDEELGGYAAPQVRPGALLPGTLGGGRPRGPAPAPRPQNGGRGNGKEGAITLGLPMAAMRVADFSIMGQADKGRVAPGAPGSGYDSGYN